MRTKKAGLEVVLEQFEAWRAKPHGRLIPDELWNAALGLLDRYTPSTICSHLRLNAQRFKQIREGRSVAVGESDPMGLGRSGAARRGRRRGRHRCSAPEQVLALAPSRNGFVELPQFGVGFGGGIMAPRPRDVERGPAGCRLTLESAAGTLTIVTANHEHSLVEAVCQFHAQRAQVLKAAYAAHPARFKHRVPTPPELPTVVGINLPKSITQPQETAHDQTTTPALLTNFLTEVSQSH